MPSLFNDLTLSLDATHFHVIEADQHALRHMPHSGRPVECLDAWLKALPKHRWSNLNRMDLVVGHPWSWVTVLPWQEGIYTEAAWEGYARACLGAPVRHGRWAVRVADAGHGQARLAVALDAEFLDAVNAVCKTAKWQLVRVRDVLTHCLDHQPVLKKTADACVLLTQRQVVTCVFREQHDWRDIVTLVRGPGDADSWLTTAALMTGRAVPSCVLAGGVDFPGLGAGMLGLASGTGRVRQARLRTVPGARA